MQRDPFEGHSTPSSASPMVSSGDFSILSEALGSGTASCIRHILVSQTPYEILQVDEDFSNGAGISKTKVKDNFTKMARVVHPDKCFHGEAQVAFSKLREAYEQINNDFRNPRPTPASLPIVQDKRRRQVATKTFNLLREVAADKMPHRGMDAGSDIRFCDEIRDLPSFSAPAEEFSPKRGKYTPASPRKKANQTSRDEKPRFGARGI
jgi:hypothetical protein